MRPFILIAILSALFIPNYAYATDWYVDGVNGLWVAPNGGGTLGSQQYPFRTPNGAWAAAQPGDTIHLLPTTTYPVVYFMNKSGKAGAPITVTGDGQYPNLTKVTGRQVNGTPNISFMIGNDSYITLTNLEIDGQYLASDTYTYECVSIQTSNHINVSHIFVHNCGGSGIGSGRSDYLNLSYNTVTQTAENIASYRGSGISTWENEDVDSNTGPKIIISSNIIYNNTNNPCSLTGNGSCAAGDTDGSGIILDDAKHTQTTNSGPAYGGQTVIEDNIIYNNGGRGITLYMSDHALVMNNTLFYNNQDPYEKDIYPGEIHALSAGDAQIYNNVFYSDGGKGNSYTGPHYAISVDDATDGKGPVTAANNIVYNLTNNSTLALHSDAASTKAGTAIFENNPFVNPLFVNASIDPTSADFHLQANSPARGTATGLKIDPIDILNFTRPITTPDIGAYQQTLPPQCGTSNSQQFTAAPAINLCAIGTPSVITKDAGAWSWTCADPTSLELVTLTGNTGTWTWNSAPAAETVSCTAAVAVSIPSPDTASDTPIINLPAQPIVNISSTSWIKGISVSDVWTQAHGNTMELGLYVTEGSLKTATTSANWALRLTGTVAQLNAALSSLQYIATSQQENAVLTITLWNLEGKNTRASLPIRVSKDIVVQFPASIPTVTAKEATAISGISIVDAIDQKQSNNVELGLYPSEGSIKTAGTSAAAGLHLQGTVSQINAALSTLQYTASGQKKNVSLTVTLWNLKGENVQATLPITVSQ